jgi:hypothetical protein
MEYFSGNALLLLAFFIALWFAFSRVAKKGDAQRNELQDYVLKSLALAERSVQLNEESNRLLVDILEALKSRRV